MGAQIIKEDNTNKFLKTLQARQLEFVTVGGHLIGSEQKSRCPKKSGYLANSIETETYVRQGEAASETGPRAEYAPYVEYGTGIYAVGGDGRKTPWWYKTPDGKWFWSQGAKAQPFAEPGYRAASQKFPGLAQRILKI